MILVGIGSNLPAPGHPDPLATCRAAVRLMDSRGLRTTGSSPWYSSAPVPADPGQPWFVNAVLALAGPDDPAGLLAALHDVEAEFGRTRVRVNEARTLDLDLLDFEGRIHPAGSWPALPHPRLHRRAFVLAPLSDLCPGWRHPVSGKSAADLIALLPAGQRVCRIDSPVRPAGGRT